MLKMMYSNLLQRPTRTMVSVLAVALGIVLILVSVGLSYGQLSETATRTRRVSGDFLFQPSDASLFFAVNSGTLPERLRGIIEKVEGVERAAPVLVKFITPGFNLVYGVDPDSYNSVSGGLKFDEGTLPRVGLQAAIDSLYSGSHKLKLGDKLHLLDHDFKVVGVFESGVGARVIIPLKTLQELNGTPDKVSLFFIRRNPRWREEAVLRNLTSAAPGYKITPASQLPNLMTSGLPVFRNFIYAVVSLATIISFLIILLAMYTTITERTREIGILKSLGASKAYIVGIILKESLLICLTGVAAGFLITLIVNRFIRMSFPLLPIEITLGWRVLAAFLGIAGGLIGALYPAFKAANQDPVQALSYE
ncbi:MAG TPA: FtsX-like permease family protein [Acidobacteriota bacterium]|jgi:putative ABC transport system permease protein